MVTLVQVLKDGSEVGATVADKINAIITDKIPEIEASIASSANNASFGYVWMRGLPVAATHIGTAWEDNPIFDTLEHQDTSGALTAGISTGNVSVTRDGAYDVFASISFVMGSNASTPSGKRVDMAISVNNVIMEVASVRPDSVINENRPVGVVRGSVKASAGDTIRVALRGGDQSFWLGTNATSFIVRETLCKVV